MFIITSIYKSIWTQLAQQLNRHRNFRSRPAFRARLTNTINRCATAFFETTGCRRQMDRLRFLTENVEPLRLAIAAGTSLDEIKPLFEKMKEAINTGTLAAGHPIEAGLGSSLKIFWHSRPQTSRSPSQSTTKPGTRSCRFTLNFTRRKTNSRRPRTRRRA
jgi:hypothetical protein